MSPAENQRLKRKHGDEVTIHGRIHRKGTTLKHDIPDLAFEIRGERLANTA